MLVNGWRRSNIGCNSRLAGNNGDMKVDIIDNIRYFIKKITSSSSILELLTKYESDHALFGVKH